MIGDSPPRDIWFKGAPPTVLGEAREFRIQEDCDSERQSLKQREEVADDQSFLNAHINAKQYPVANAACIASDDPRLKEK